MVDVLNIFQIKSKIPSATKVARFYGVSEKTIRDIWTGRTWAAQTWHLDKSRVLKIKPTGRPIGRRDTKPRKPRQSSKIDGHRVPKPALATGTLSFLEDIRSGDMSIIDKPDCNGPSYHKSLDELLSDWEPFWRNAEWSDPFASDWLHQSL
jgi:hypothetical protein